ncbi:AraC family transcriptional regulator [Lacibacter luteus]|uniref:AraC family transcriptional regulator n=1 Tax=Lacibacter luteus TaxID=2508719 RepID=A0A4Q1CNV9_9BACT|nr:helix-turn-helix transcriptional regulator [Lacibacter luteus]RXK62770.1 AraC family transcriptional regulator [Lacibacter luteus]
MITLDLQHTDYHTLLQSFAAQLNCAYEDNVLQLPAHVGEGFFKLVELPNGLQALLSDITYNTDVTFRRTKSEIYYCVLYFNDSALSEPLQFERNGKWHVDKSIRRSGISLVSSTSDMSFTMKAKTKARTINLLLPELWINSNLNRYNELHLLMRFNQQQNSISYPEPFDAQNRILFDEVFETEESNPMQQMIVKNRIMLLLEQFLSKVHRKMEENPDAGPRKIKPADLSKLMEIEAILVQDFGQPPPTIVTLAGFSKMSVSKLKSTFKKVYGTGIYEYYQKNRMLKARALLLTGKYNVKEVGTQLGYTNLSNFSLAFKKEFGLLPSEV